MSQDKQLTELNNLSSIPNSGAKVYVRDENESLDENKDKQLDLSVIKDEIDTKAPSSHSHSIDDVTGLQGALDAKEPTIAAGTTSQYYRGDKTFQPLNKATVGLGNVDNTSDANKPISTATQTALNSKANVSHTHTKNEITDFNDADYASASHTHDDRYYTESEIDNMLANAGGGAELIGDVNNSSGTARINNIDSAKYMKIFGVCEMYGSRPEFRLPQSSQKFKVYSGSVRIDDGENIHQNRLNSDADNIPIASNSVGTATTFFLHLTIINIGWMVITWQGHSYKGDQYYGSAIFDPGLFNSFDLSTWSTTDSRLKLWGVK